MEELEELCLEVAQQALSDMKSTMRRLMEELEEDAFCVALLQPMEKSLRDVKSGCSKVLPGTW